MLSNATCTAYAEDVFEPRKSNCELFGYDFVIDDSLKVGLYNLNDNLNAVDPCA